MRLSYKVLGGAAVALAALTSRADAGTLSGKLTDMFSGAPYNEATITAVNESTQEAYDATSGPNATAVQPESWGRIKRNFNIIVPSAGSRKRGQLENTLNEGFYTLDLPDGNYTVAFTDGNPGSAKPTSGDLANLQIDSNDRFYPRTLRLGVNGNIGYDERLVPRDFDLEYAWTVLRGQKVGVDYDNTIFYVDTGKARKNYRPDPNGKEPSSGSVDALVSAIREAVKLNTNGVKIPRIEIGNNPPGDVVPGYTKNPKGGNMVVPGYVLFFWDDGLPLGFIGSSSRDIDEDGTIISAGAQFRSYAGPSTFMHEVLATLGMFGEPSTNEDLERRIRDTGGSIFLDLDGVTDVSSPTQRDLQIIQFHGQRPLLTKPVDVTEVPFESAQ